MSIENHEYILIQGWMINELELKGNDLLVYAIIHRYSQDGIHRFYGSLKYLAEWTNSTTSGIQKNIKNLLDKGLILKNKVGESDYSKCEYWVNLNIQQSCITVQQSCNPLQLSCSNNINNNIIKNNLFISKDINKAKPQILEKDIYFENNKKSKSFKVLKTWVELYIDNQELRNSLVSWLGIMYSNKKIANLECLKNKIDMLNENNLTEDEKIRVIKDATDKIWFTFQYSIDRIKKQPNNPIVVNRNTNNLDLSNEVF